MEFITDPWNVRLASWSMFEIVSAVIQLHLGYVALSIILNLWLDP